MEKTETFGLCASYFIGISALLFQVLGHTGISSLRKRKDKKGIKDTTTTKDTGSLH